MKIIKYSFLILITLIVIALFTNPGIERHKTAVKEKVQNSMNQTLAKQGISKDNILVKSLTNDMFEDMIWNVIDNNIQYRNYYIFSISQASYLSESYPISIGFYNYVMVMPQLEKQIENKINSYIKDNGGLKELLGF